MVTDEDNAGSSYDVSFDSLVQILVAFVKQGKICVLFSGRLKQQLPCNAGNRNGCFENIYTFIEIELLKLLYSLNKRLDVQIVVPYQEVLKCIHSMGFPDFLAVDIIIV